MLPRRPAITPHRALGLPVEGTSLGQHRAPSNALARYPRILHHPVCHLFVQEEPCHGVESKKMTGPISAPCRVSVQSLSAWL